jgi:hypothetical protein
VAVTGGLLFKCLAIQVDACLAEPELMWLVDRLSSIEKEVIPESMPNSKEQLIVAASDSCL